MGDYEDKAMYQLLDWHEGQIGKPHRALTANGIPIASLTKTLTAGPGGPVLLQDNFLIENTQHWVRERIPERTVHAKGAGAFGYFEVTGDITKYSKAILFRHLGKVTPVAVRFSTMVGECGSAETVRDPRGFAIKFYTEDGNWDLVGHSSPIFFVRDPLLFPSLIRSQKRNPETNLKDPNMMWDFISLRPETIHQTCLLYSDRGIPDGYRHMNGYGCHTFKMVNSSGKQVYCKFHLKTNQGVKNIPVNEAFETTAEDPDFATRDLYNAIANEACPSWTMYIQVMTLEEADELAWDAFDLTKVWPHSKFPLIPVGKLVLDRNASNYFAQVEQLAYSPANLIPGIEPSPDKMLQARLFAYGEAHRHRLGPNYEMIPANCPNEVRKRCTYIRDGAMVIQHQGGAPNYFPNSFSGPLETPEVDVAPFKCEGVAKRYNDDDEWNDFRQVQDFWAKVLSPEERERLAKNLADNLECVLPFIQDKCIKLFSKVHPDLGKMIQEELDAFCVLSNGSSK